MVASPHAAERRLRLSTFWAVLVVGGFILLMWRLQSTEEALKTLQVEQASQPNLTVHVTKWLLKWAREGGRHRLPSKTWRAAVLP